MSRSKGIASFSANFEPQIAAPLDARQIVATQADLLSATTWQANDGSVYAYVGMIVAVNNDLIPSNNGIYRLTAADYTQLINWEKAGAGGGMSWEVVSADTTATAGSGYLVDASSDDIIITLPLTPAEGDQVGICDYLGKATTHIITIARNGNKIHGDTEDIIIDLNYAGFTLTYSDSNQGWELTDDIGSQINWGEITGSISAQSDLQDALDSRAILWTIVNTNTQAIRGRGYLVDATGGNVTITLPLNPIEGDKVGISDFYAQALTNTITVARNGNKIHALEQDLIVDIVSSSFTLIYTDAVRGWEIINDIGVAAWGYIGGTLSNQSDLQAALDAKANASAYTQAQDYLNNFYSM